MSYPAIAESHFDHDKNGNGLNVDGTLESVCSYFRSKNDVAMGHDSRRMSKVWNDLKRNIFISPAFLAIVLFIVLCVPRSLLQLRPHLSTYATKISKRILDIVGSVVGLFISSVFFLFLPVLIRLDSKGKVFFQQKRTGADLRRGDRRKISLKVPYERRKGDRRKQNVMGQPFEVFKFRSMQENAEQNTGPIWAKRDDPRTTRVGKILRSCHLDEIPQFVNVLKGEMSLVGPRPERPEFIFSLNEEIPNYKRRLDCKPGITGLAQICCGYDSSVSDVAKKLEYDLFYIRNRNILLDIRILLTTLKIVVWPNNRGTDYRWNGIVPQEKDSAAHHETSKTDALAYGP